MRFVGGGKRPADPTPQGLPAALPGFGERGSLPMCSERNGCPRKKAWPPITIASRSALPPLNTRCSVLGLTSWRSIFHDVVGGGAVLRAPLAGVTGKLGSPLSV